MNYQDEINNLNEALKGIKNELEKTRRLIEVLTDDTDEINQKLSHGIKARLF